MLTSTRGLQAIDIGVSGFLTNKAAVVNQLNNIFNISKYTFPFRREFDIDIESYLFRPFNIITSNLIQIEIENGILRYIPKMTIAELDIDLDYTNRLYNLNMWVSHPTFDDNYNYQTGYQSNV